MSRNTKIIIYRTLIRPVITYGAEAWTMSSETGKRLTVFEREVLRKIPPLLPSMEIPVYC
jgi:hypothetical protein